MRLERRVLEREGFMQYFEKQGNALIFRQDGETVRVEPWQKDSRSGERYASFGDRRGKHCTA